MRSGSMKNGNNIGVFAKRSWIDNLNKRLNFSKMKGETARFVNSDFCEFCFISLKNRLWEVVSVFDIQKVWGIKKIELIMMKELFY